MPKKHEGRDAVFREVYKLRADLARSTRTVERAQRQYALERAKALTFKAENDKLRAQLVNVVDWFRTWDVTIGPAEEALLEPIHELLKETQK